jgi:hypothetical protein
MLWCDNSYKYDLGIANLNERFRINISVTSSIEPDDPLNCGLPYTLNSRCIVNKQLNDWICGRTEISLIRSSIQNNRAFLCIARF